METKKSTVKRVYHETKTYTGKYGQMYVHKIEFDNGDKGEYHSQKSVCEKFEEGKEADYTIESKVNGQYTNIIIKPVKENTFSGGGAKKSTGGVESFALSYAKDVACAYIQSGKEFKSNQIIEVAEAFYNWLKSKSNS